MSNWKVDFCNIKDMEKQDKQKFKHILKCLSIEFNKIIEGSETGEITILDINIENEMMETFDSQYDIPNRVNNLKIRYCKGK